MNSEMLSKIYDVSDHTGMKCPQSMTLCHLIEIQAEQNPKAIAIAAPGRIPLNYGRLDVHVNNVVKKLNAMGFGRNDRVAIVLPNGPEIAVAFLAVAAGASVAPLNPGYRESEFGFYLSDLNARALIVQAGIDSSARAAAKARDIPIIELFPMSGEPAGLFTLSGDKRSEVIDSGFAQSDHIALVLHTSGTTSRPKIVPLTQANICTSAQNIQAALKLSSCDRCLNVMPLFHIHGLIGAIVSSIVAGASVFCTPGFSAPDFFQWLQEYRPTWYTAVPTMHQTIVDSAASHHDIIASSPLRFIRSCSSSLPPSLMAELESGFKVPVIEAYGMTEASHQITSNPLPPRERKAGSVGVAAGPEVAIMDEAGNLLAPGEIGEIVIRGANVMRGYENNPDANKNVATKGWFRTGDQGYLDPDRYLFITGRLKEIINRGGKKISPREVDEAVMDHPAVAQVVTFAVAHPKLGEDVVTAVVLQENAIATEREIRAFAFERLADHKVPTKVLIVDEIPKGPTGKLRRNNLAEKLAPEMKAEFIPPRNPVENTLVRIWGEVLGIEQVGIYENFFTLGGDSLSATRAVSRVSAAFNVDLPVTTIFKEPNVADLAIVIEKILMKAREIDHQEMVRILAEVEELSEEEAHRLFVEEMKRTLDVK